jgi:hypothetical protein
VAFTSVPDLAGLRLKPSILWDGIYAPPGWPHFGPLPAGVTTEAQAEALAGIVSIVTIGTLGVTPEVAASNIPRVRDAVDWMIRDYTPPPFPGQSTPRWPGEAARSSPSGHRLDFRRVGIDGDVAADGVYRHPAGYRPWMLPEVYDTRTAGRSSAGHTEPFDGLAEPDKQALIEFLKRV